MIARYSAPSSDRTGILTVIDSKTGAMRTSGRYDLVIWASMAAFANMPRLRGAEVFRGSQLHTTQFSTTQLEDIVRNNRRVVVVGGGKAGCDFRRGIELVDLQIAAVLGALGVPVLAQRAGILVAMSTLSVLWSTIPLGLIFLPDGWAAWALLGGVAQGGGITLVFMIVVQLAFSDPQRATVVGDDLATPSEPTMDLPIAYRIYEAFHL